MKKVKTFYKVVQRGDELSFLGRVVHKDELWSCCLNQALMSNWRVQYKIGQFVKVNELGTKLFVFQTLKDAKRFKSNGLWEIWECEVGGRITKILDCPSLYDCVVFWKEVKAKKLSIKRLVHKYKGHRPFNPRLSTNRIPACLVDSVKLIKKCE